MSTTIPAKESFVHATTRRERATPTGVSDHSSSRSPNHVPDDSNARSKAPLRPQNIVTTISKNWAATSSAVASSAKLRTMSNRSPTRFGIASVASSQAFQRSRTFIAPQTNTATNIAISHAIQRL